MVVSKKVTDWRQLKLPIYLYAAAIGAGAAFLCVPLLQSSFKGDALGLFTTILLVIFLPVFAIAFAMIRNNPSMFKRKVLEFQETLFAEARDAIVREIGHAPKFMDFCMHPSADRETLIAAAIAYDSRKIYLIENGNLAVIPWKDVRNYSTKIDGYDQVQTRDKNLATRAATQDQNRDAYQAALLASGLTISVADINKPSWQFICDDAQTLTKWFEILTQVNEGRIDPVPA